MAQQAAVAFLGIEIFHNFRRGNIHRCQAIAICKRIPTNACDISGDFYGCDSHLRKGRFTNAYQRIRKLERAASIHIRKGIIANFCNAVFYLDAFNFHTVFPGQTRG